jgi:glycosyltransferase involved in cell wall biosynthesis
MRGLPWSFSAHARDIWTTPEWELREKLADCAWGVSCTAAGTDYLNALGAPPRSAPVALVYHGLDLARFPDPPATHYHRDGRTPDSAVRLISVGRAVVKKGFDILLRALALLPRELHWRLQHLGGGPELAKLKAQAHSLGLGQHITWCGSVDQAAIISALRESDLFALACRIGPDGDRDGIPNVLLEAQSQALACVTSDLSAIPEFIIDGETGLLCPPEDIQAFATALAQLIRDPKRRAHMGRQGRIRLESRFQMQHTIDGLVERFRNNSGKLVCA